MDSSINQSTTLDMELTTDTNTFIFLNQNENEQIKWFQQIENVLKGQIVCCYKFIVMKWIKIIIIILL